MLQWRRKVRSFVSCCCCSVGLLKRHRLVCATPQLQSLHAFACAMALFLGGGDGLRRTPMPPVAALIAHRHCIDRGYHCSRSRRNLELLKKKISLICTERLAQQQQLQVLGVKRSRLRNQFKRLVLTVRCCCCTAHGLDVQVVCVTSVMCELIHRGCWLLLHVSEPIYTYGSRHLGD